MAVANKAVTVHQVQGSLVEAVQVMPYTTSQTFKIGEFLQLTSGLLVVSVADPASGTIVGISLQAADTNPGFSMANSPATITGRNQTVSVIRPNDNTIFVSQFTQSSSTVIAPANTDIGVQYGITAYSGVWTVDKGKTGANARVTIVGVDTVLNQVFWKVIASFLA